MKNNKLLYLLTIFITLFTFNINANAAQEMTCVYKGTKEQIDAWKNMPEYYVSRIAITQYKNDERIIRYEYNNNEKWVLNHEYNIELVNDNTLTECPNYAFLALHDSYEYYIDFYDEASKYGNKKDIFEKSNDSTIGGISEFSNIITKSFTEELTNPEKDNFVGLENSIYTSEKYTGICKYKMFLINERNNHYIQINLSQKEILVTQYDPLTKKLLDDDTIKEKTYKTKPDIINHILKIDTLETNSLKQFYNIMEENNGNCPKKIYVNRNHSKYGTEVNNGLLEANITTTISFNKSSGYKEYLLYYGEGENPYIPGIKLLYDDKLNVKINDFIDIQSCTDLLGDDIPKYFDIIWNLVKIGIPILLIAFATIDIIQAIFSNKEDGMKKAQEKMIKRIIIAVIIFIIPSLISFLLNIANSIWPNIGTDICGIIF